MGWSKDPGPPKGGEVPRHFYYRGVMKSNDLSIFVDESGDFGAYDTNSPFYIATLVFHDQSKDISENISKFDNFLTMLGFNKLMIHTGPIIRQENIFRNIEKSIRRKLLNRFIAFTKQLDIKYISFVIDKKETKDITDLSGKLAKQIHTFISNNIDFFSNRNTIKIYYDNGQIELSKILSSTFYILLSNTEFRKIKPSDYRLFQVADLFCTIESLKLKIKNKNLTNSEKTILGNETDIKKNIINPLKDKVF